MCDAGVDGAIPGVGADDAGTGVNADVDPNEYSGFGAGTSGYAVVPHAAESGAEDCGAALNDKMWCYHHVNKH